VPPRIHLEKGAAEAIGEAVRAGWPLIIQDREYVERFEEARVDETRAVCRRRRSRALQRAARRGACPPPLDRFDELFGFSVVEVMACGTPVITHARGSMSEIVREGQNGFLVASADDAVSAPADIHRTELRASVEHRFDADRMVDDYLAVYRCVLELYRGRDTDG